MAEYLQAASAETLLTFWWRDITLNIDGEYQESWLSRTFEDEAVAAELLRRFAETERQRDRLMAALKDVVMKVDQRWLDLDQARAAIAEVEADDA
jgi:hypothetical protein